MGVAPDLARKILWRLLDGRDPVAIACEVPCGYADVAAVQASLDMVELAAECAADGSRVVIEARDDDEAAALRTMARAAQGFGGARITVDGPAAVRFAAPAEESQAKPAEAAAIPAEATTVAGDARIESVAATDRQADDAGSRASGGVGSTAPIASAAGSYSPAGGATDGAVRSPGAGRPRQVGGGDVPGSLSPIASPIRTGSSRRLPEDALRGAVAAPAPARGHAPRVGGSRAVILSTLPNAQFASLYLGRRYDLDGLTAAQAARLRSRRS